jgi:hypothetical protein
MIFKHFTDKPFTRFKKCVLTKNLKPSALWLSCGNDWINSEFGKYKYEYTYEFNIDKSKLIILNNYKDIKKLNDIYGYKFYLPGGKTYLEELNYTIDWYEGEVWYIDWKKVSKDYYGIFIKNPDIKKARKDFLWYSSIDVCCVALWNKKAIISWKEL